MIEAWLASLRAAGVTLNDRDAADALWLARLLPPSPPPSDAVPGDRTVTAEHPIPNRASLPQTAAERLRERRRVRISSGTMLRDQQALYASTPTVRAADQGVIPVSRVRVPSAPGLHQTLAIARALRPLARRFPSRHALVLDDEATAHASAEAGVLTPVFRPLRERWFDVALIVDDVPSMALWRRPIAEFHRLLQQHGAFRDVRRWTLSVSGKELHLIDPAGAARPTRELRDPEARRLILVVSDCVSAPWYGHSMAKLLADWAATTPVAVVQLLPDHLWSRTALGQPRARFGAATPGISNARLFVERPWWDDDPIDNHLPLPVVNLAPHSIGDWSRMVMGMGARARGVILDSHLAEREVASEDVPAAAVPPTEAAARVARFRSLVSVDAYRLAMYLAAVPLTLPVMRLVQAAMFVQPLESHLAEVFLGGIIERTTPADASATDDDVEYEFAAEPGEAAAGRGSAVRDTLLRSIRRTEVHRVLGAVSDYVSSRVGATVDFSAWVQSAAGTDTLPAAALPFARLASATMQRLGAAVTERTIRPTESPSERPGAGGEREIEEEVFGPGLTISRRIALPHPAEQVAWSPNGQLIAVRHAHALSIVDAGKGIVEATMTLSDDETTTTMVWSQSSSEVAFAANTPSTPGVIYIVNAVKTFSTVGVSPPGAPAVTAMASIVDIDWRLPDELTIGMVNGVVAFWKRGTSPDLFSSADLLNRLTPSLRGVSWSNSAQSLAVLVEPGQVLVSQAFGDRVFVVNRAKIDWPVPSCAPLVWEPDDRWLAAATRSGQVTILETSGYLQASLVTDSAEVRSLSASRDGAFLVGVGESTGTPGSTRTMIWRMPTGEAVAVVTESRADNGYSVAAFSPTAATLAHARATELRLVRVHEAELRRNGSTQPPIPTPQAAVEVERYAVGVVGFMHGDVAVQRFIGWFRSTRSGDPSHQIILGGSAASLPDGRDATMSNIEEAVRGFASPTTGSTARRQLILYIAANAERTTTGEIAFTLPEGTPGVRLSILLREILDLVAADRMYDQVCVIVDAEESPTSEPLTLVPTLLPSDVANTQPMSLAVLYSGRFYISHDWPFTDAVIDGLSGQAANASGDVTVSSLSNCVRLRRDELLRERQDDVARYTPVTVDVTGEDAVLARVELARITLDVDRMFTGRTIRVFDQSLTPALTLADDEASQPHALPPGFYFAEVDRLPIREAIEIGLNATDFTVRVAWKPTPYRVVVAGTGTGTLSPNEQSACYALGVALAQCGMHLVTGGWPGVDHAVARAFAAQFASARDDRSQQRALIDQQLTQIIEPWQKEPDFKGGRVHMLGDQETLGGSLDNADALVVIGGRGAVAQLAGLAATRGLLVIPWQSTGGAAAEMSVSDPWPWQSRGLEDWRWLRDPISDAASTDDAAARIVSAVARIAAALRAQRLPSA